MEYTSDSDEIFVFGYVVGIFYFTQICLDRGDDCFAVEYQSIFRQCWIFISDSMDSGCGKLIENRLVYHIKRSSCDDWNGKLKYPMWIIILWLWQILLYIWPMLDNQLYTLSINYFVKNTFSFSEFFFHIKQHFFKNLWKPCEMNVASSVGDACFTSVLWNKSAEEIKFVGTCAFL